MADSHPAAATCRNFGADMLGLPSGGPEGTRLRGSLSPAASSGQQAGRALQGKRRPRNKEPSPPCALLSVAKMHFFFFFRVHGRRPCVRSAQPHAHAHLPILYLVTVPKASTLVSPSESCAHLSLTGPNTRDLGPHLRQQSRCRHVKRESLETDWVSQALVQFDPAPHLYF